MWRFLTLSGSAGGLDDIPRFGQSNYREGIFGRTRVSELVVPNACNARPSTPWTCCLRSVERIPLQKVACIFQLSFSGGLWGAKLNTGRRETWTDLSHKLVAFGMTHVSNSMDDQTALAELAVCNQRE